MSTLASAVSVEEYLKTSYRPDCDYLDGTVLERNVGEEKHSRLHAAIVSFLFNREKQLGIRVYPEQRVQVSQRRFRVPDICVVLDQRPRNAIFREPPLICIEILSKDDTMSSMQERIHDYLQMGVPSVWVIDPVGRWASSYTVEGSREALDGVLRAAGVELPIRDLFEILD